MQSQDRGQLFVIAALALAILIIGVALLLNSGLYAANLAAQNTDSGVDDSREFLREAEIGANRVMSYANYNNFSSYDELRRNFRVGVHNWSERAHHHRALTGEGVEIREVNVTNGSRITQNSSDRAFTNSAGDDDWTLGTGLQGVRQFRINLTNDSLETGPSTETATAYENSPNFRIRFTDDGGSTWQVYVNRSASGERVYVRVNGSGSGLSDPCSTGVNSNGRTTLYLSDGLIGGEHCEQLTFIQGLSTPFRINYTNGSNIGGSYELFVNNKSSTSLADGDFASSPPTLERAIYEATLSIEYTSGNTRISGNRTARPDRRRYLAGGSSGPSVPFAFDDADNDLEFDPGETEYTESEVISFSDNTVNLVIPANGGDGTLDNPTGSISIQANNITSRVDMDADTSISLDANGNTINVSGTISAGSGSNIQLNNADEVYMKESTITTTGDLQVPNNNNILNFDNSTINVGKFSPQTWNRISGRNSQVTTTSQIQAGTNTGPLDLRGADISAGGKIQIQTISGDFFLNDTSYQNARIESTTSDKITVKFDDPSRTFYIGGVVIIDDDNEIKCQTQGGGAATKSGTPDSGTVSNCN